MTNHQRFIIPGEPFDIHAHMAVKSRNVRNAVVFLHGFQGSPYNTWDRFSDLINFSAEAVWQESDLYFLEYATIWRSLGNSAWDFVEFLEDLLGDPRGFVQNLTESEALASLRPEESYKYSQLTLIGHSMGAVVIRKAIVDAVRRPAALSEENFRRLLTDARVLLYAPAIGGFRLAGFKGFVASAPMIRTMAMMAKSGVTSLGELAENSPFLQSIRQATEHFANQTDAPSCYTASIAWAENENVIENFCGYLHDVDQVRIPSANHWTVCKPSYEGDPTFYFLRSRVV